MIASIGLVLDREMVTRDLRFQEAAGLAMVGWRKERGLFEGGY